MYVKKIKIFECCCYEDLENKVNKFLAKEITQGFNIIDIKYQITPILKSQFYSCLIYYSEPVPEKAG